jgi:hypothetical protein
MVCIKKPALRQFFDTAGLEAGIEQKGGREKVFSLHSEESYSRTRRVSKKERSDDASFLPPLPAKCLTLVGLFAPLDNKI